MANELSLTAQFINSTLLGAAAVTALVGARIYPEIGPENGTYPMIVFGFLSSPDRNAVGADRRIFTEPMFVVRAVALNSMMAAGAIADAIDDALVGTNNNAVLNPALHVQGIFREMPVRYVEQVQGTRYVHVGGRYRLFVHTNA